VAIAIAGLCAASPASAAKPAITHSVEQGTITDIQACGTVHVDITFRDEITTRVFYEDGDSYGCSAMTNGRTIRYSISSVPPWCA
jgi:hypothetical protein